VKNGRANVIITNFFQTKWLSHPNKPLAYKTQIRDQKISMSKRYLINIM